MTEYLPVIAVAGVVILGGIAVTWVRSLTSRKDKV